jgi:hypothetical protein
MRTGSMRGGLLRTSGLLTAALLFAARLGGCSGGDVEPDACADAPTWDTFAQGYVHTWCLPCHSSAVTGFDRQGAPDGVNFDIWSEVHGYKDRIAVRSVDPTSPMPPQGGVPQEELDLLLEWIECGAEGSDEPPGPCEGVAQGPATTVASQADADALCRDYGAVDALTISGAATVDCLCRVAGDLTVSGGAADLPLLAEVGGSVSLQDGAGALRAPALRAIGGDLVAREAAALTELAVPLLVDVGGRVQLEDLDQLAVLDLSYLYGVGGELVIRRASALPLVDLPRLRTVGGDLVLEDLAEVTALVGTESVEEIGGSLIVRRLPSLFVLDDWAFDYLRAVGQDVVIAQNDQLVAIHGFPALGYAAQFPGATPGYTWALPGDLVVEDNPRLIQVPGFDNLRQVAGDVRFRNNTVQQSVLGLVNLERVDGVLLIEDLPRLDSLAGFEALESVGDLRIGRVGETALTELPQLVAVDRDLAIDTCPNLQAIVGLPQLSAVGGTLDLTANTALTNITGLSALATVGGDLNVLDNAVLPTATIEAWAAGIAVGGAVTVSDNGP